MKAIAVIGGTAALRDAVCHGMIGGLSANGHSVGHIHELDREADTLPATEQAGRGYTPALRAEHGPAGTQLRWPRQLDISELLRYCEQDYVVLENMSDCLCPRIMVADSEQDIAAAHADSLAIAIVHSLGSAYKPPAATGLPLFAAAGEGGGLIDLIQGKAFAPLPDFDPQCCTACGHSCRQLAELIVDGSARREDCRLSCQQVELVIDGRAVPMVPFVQAILRNAVLGVAQELEGFSPHCEIEVRFRV